MATASATVRIESPERSSPDGVLAEYDTSPGWIAVSQLHPFGTVAPVIYGLQCFRAPSPETSSCLRADAARSVFGLEMALERSLAFFLLNVSDMCPRCSLNAIAEHEREFREVIENNWLKHKGRKLSAKVYVRRVQQIERLSAR